MLESGREVSVGGRRDEEEDMLMAGRLGPGEWRRWTRWGTHGPLSRAKTGLAFLPLSLRGLGLFTLFWLGEREKVTGLPSSGGVLASWGLLRSEASIYPREWGTERKGTLGFLMEKVLGTNAVTPRRPTRVVEMGQAGPGSSSGSGG